MKMDQESSGIALVSVCVCMTDVGGLDWGLVFLYSIFYTFWSVDTILLSSIFYIIYSIFVGPMLVGCNFYHENGLHDGMRDFEHVSLR